MQEVRWKFLTCVPLSNKIMVVRFHLLLVHVQPLEFLLHFRVFKVRLLVPDVSLCPRTNLLDLCLATRSKFVQSVDLLDICSKQFHYLVTPKKHHVSIHNSDSYRLQHVCLAQVLVRDIWVFERSLFHDESCWRLCGKINV